MSAYLSSPDFLPYTYYFTDEEPFVVRQRVRIWMKDKEIKAFPTRGDDEEFLLVNFGNVTSVRVSPNPDIPGDPPRTEIFLSRIAQVD